MNIFMFYLGLTTALLLTSIWVGVQANNGKWSSGLFLESVMIAFGWPFFLAYHFFIEKKEKRVDIFPNV